jgi:hypothetical protein
MLFQNSGHWPYRITVLVERLPRLCLLDPAADRRVLQLRGPQEPLLMACLACLACVAVAVVGPRSDLLLISCKLQSVCSVFIAGGVAIRKDMEWSLNVTQHQPIQRTNEFQPSTCVCMFWRLLFICEIESKIKVVAHAAWCFEVRRLGIDCFRPEHWITRKHASLVSIS